MPTPLIGHKTGSTLSVIGWHSGQGSSSPLTRAFHQVWNCYWPLSLPPSALTVQAPIFGDGQLTEVAWWLTARSPLPAHSPSRSPARGSSGPIGRYLLCTTFCCRKADPVICRHIPWYQLEGHCWDMWLTCCLHLAWTCSYSCFVGDLDRLEPSCGAGGVGKSNQKWFWRIILLPTALHLSCLTLSWQTGHCSEDTCQATNLAGWPSQTC